MGASLAETTTALLLEPRGNKLLHLTDHTAFIKTQLGSVTPQPRNGKVRIKYLQNNIGFILLMYL